VIVMTGAGYGLIIGPLVIALALAFWLFLVVFAARRHKHPAARRGEKAETRGPVSGGVIRGSPGQVNAGHDDFE
jgi:hypothetical protein